MVYLSIVKFESLINALQHMEYYKAKDLMMDKCTMKL